MGRGIDLSVALSDDLKAKLLARLWAKTTVVPGPRAAELGDCWIWGGYSRNGFHGALSVHDHPEYIHQLSFAIHHGPIAPGCVVRHSCDNGRCWRPEHVLPGTQLDNVRDAWDRGRASKPPHSFGEAHHRATLSDAQVAEIRALWAAGGMRQRDIAARFGCTQSTVWRFIHGATRQKGLA